MFGGSRGIRGLSAAGCSCSRRGLRRRAPAAVRMDGWREGERRGEG
jgi:hypothetical protein